MKLMDEKMCGPSTRFVPDRWFPACIWYSTYYYNIILSTKKLKGGEDPSKNLPVIHYTGMCDIQ